MLATDFKEGNRFQNKVTKEIYGVEDLFGGRIFVNQDSGDTYTFLDEDLFNDLEYYSEIKGEF